MGRINEERPRRGASNAKLWKRIKRGRDIKRRKRQERMRLRRE